MTFGGSTKQKTRFFGAVAFYVAAVRSGIESNTGGDDVFRNFGLSATLGIVMAVGGGTMGLSNFTEI